MKTIRTLALCGLICVTGLSNSYAFETTTVPVANVEESEVMSVYDALQYFTAKVQRWRDGQPITLFILPKSHLSTRAFVFEHLGISSTQYYELLEVNITTRKKNAVVFVDTETEVLKKILITPGGLGYVNDHLIVNEGNNHIRVIKIK